MAELTELDRLFKELRDKDTKFTSALLRQHDVNFASTNARYRPELDNEATQRAREDYKDITQRIMGTFEKPEE